MFTSLLLLQLASTPALASGLDDRVGQTEVRITSAGFRPAIGRTTGEQHIKERLDRLDYHKVQGRPETPGTWSSTADRVWIYRRAHRNDGRDLDAVLFGLALDKSSRVTGFVDAQDRPTRSDKPGLWLDPEVLADGFEGSRAARIPVELSALPEHVWRPLLALEDSRFFSHPGVDPRSVLRAAMRNARAGKTVQGASTITQQLVKNRDLTSERTWRRKANEAVRAVGVEVRWTKAEILQSYLNTVYYGHVGGVSVYGIGAAAQVFFNKAAADLSMAEAATLAAVVQAPNGLSPVRHPDKATARRDRALDRMAELEWASAADVQAAKVSALVVDVQTPRAVGSRHLRSHLRAVVNAEEPERIKEGKGVALQATVDPWLQHHAETLVAAHLDDLRRRYPKLRTLDLTAALVLLDAETGDVLAQVGGDPADPSDALDRATRAKRQPGSLIKPFVLAEALEDCGDERPLHAASWISDAPLTLELPGADAWTVHNYDNTHHGDVMLRSALVKSYNIPFVRVAQHCGFDNVARRLDRAGLPLPDPAPPSFVLGAVEASPQQLAGAYAAFATDGRSVTPDAVQRMETPRGRRLHTHKTKRRRVAAPSTAYITRSLLADAVQVGTGKNAQQRSLEISGKTGTSSNLRDAWFAGSAEGVVAVAWVGLDGGGRVGLTGGTGAAPLAGKALKAAVTQRAPDDDHSPAGVLIEAVDPKTGYLMPPGSEGAIDMPFKKRNRPGKRFFWRSSAPDALQ